jgi:hypothetical protein
MRCSSPPSPPREMTTLPTGDLAHRQAIVAEHLRESVALGQSFGGVVVALGITQREARTVRVTNLIRCRESAEQEGPDRCR